LAIKTQTSPSTGVNRWVVVAVWCYRINPTTYIL